MKTINELKKNSILNQVHQQDIEHFNRKHENACLPNELIQYYEIYGNGRLRSKKDEGTICIYYPKQIDHIIENKDNLHYFLYDKKFLKDQIVFANCLDTFFIGIGYKDYNYNQIFLNDVRISNSLELFLNDYTIDNNFFISIVEANNPSLTDSFNRTPYINNYYKYDNTNIYKYLNPVYFDDLEDIESININIPSDLLKFYRKYGWGVLLSNENNINILFSLQKIYSFQINSSTFNNIDDYKKYKNKELVFLKDENNRYISIGLKWYNYNKIYYKGKKVANSLEDYLTI